MRRTTLLDVVKPRTAGERRLVRAFPPTVAALAFAVVSTACGSSDTSGKGDAGGSGNSGGLIFKLPDGGGGANGSGGTANVDFGTLPPGFTAADVGGYELGDPIPTDGGSPIGLDAGTGADAGTSGCGTKLLAVVRDFRADQVNFEGNIADDRGLVEDTLGADEKPVFAKTGPTATTSGPTAFNQFYRTVPGVNDPYVLYLWFEPTAGVLTFHSSAFFPLDGKGFGNEGNPHNFHFTTELHTRFHYNGGETFQFVGDDDLWVFINKKLAIDLGGVHTAETMKVDLDAKAKDFGIVKGNTYSLDLFHAERHTTQSNFRVDTDLAFVDCGEIVPDIH